MTTNQLSPEYLEILKNRIIEIKKRIFCAAELSGRNASEIFLMAVTKTVPPEIVNIATNSGIDLIGENRVQEFLSKLPKYNANCEDIHFIGHLQTNKVRKILDKVSVIESVDSISLAKEINRIAAEQNKKVQIFLEINIGKEETKFGFFPENLKLVFKELSELPNLAIKGLMAIPPKGGGKYYFQKMQELYIDISPKNIDNIDVSNLSMGTSADFETAIEFGSNIVRIGTAIFGKR